MNAVCKYILSVICTVLLCGTVKTLFPADKKIIMKMVTGLAMTVVVLSPLLTVEKISFRTHFDDILADGDIAVQRGILAAKESSAKFIKEKSEAYVLNKASELGAQVSVNVNLSDTELPTPSQITVCGTVSPYIKMKLTECIREELGIVEDDQEWIS